MSYQLPLKGKLNNNFVVKKIAFIKLIEKLDRSLFIFRTSDLKSS